MIANPSTPRRERCTHHPDRPAHALCVSCRTALCRGCATPWEGIFLCASCLSARRKESEKRGTLRGWLGLGLGLATAAILAVFFGAWVFGLCAELLAGAAS